MKKWMKTAGLLFMATASVYSDRAIAAKPGSAANSSDKSAGTQVKLLDEVDPFASPGPTTEPANTNEPKVPVAPVQMNPDGTFSLNITADADVVEQLRVIGFQAQESIIPSKEVHGKLPAMDLYNVTVHEALDALLHANGYAWREKGKFIYVYSAKEIEQLEKEARQTQTAVFRLSYTTAADAKVMITPVLSKDGGEIAITPAAKSGISTGVGDVGGDNHANEDMLVVTDYPENLERVRQILKEIDRRPQQILIEATILSAQLSEDNALGVDFNVVGGVDFANVTQSIAGIAPAFGVGSTTVDGNAHSVGTGNSFSSPIKDGLKVGVVTNNVSVFLSALEGVTDTTVLANPKILSLNKQKGEVIVGKETGYKTTTQTETTTTETIEFLKTGTRLIFRPYIGDDGYIRMEVHPEDSSGGLQTADNLPFKFTTEVTTNVMVKDGRTIVIGGLFREETTSTKSQIPVAGNLPIVGPLFRNQADHTGREEVIILLTPHIVKDEVEYAEISEQAMKDANKIRAGLRKGLMFWGRERLSEMNYEIATSEMSKSHPDRKRAIWHLDAAINLNPKFLEAIKLKQDLTGEEISSVTNGPMHDFMGNAILKDRAPATRPSVEATPAPATQPTVAAAAPASQPAVVAAVPEQAPTSQPAIVEVAMAPTTAPSTQPVAEADAQPQDWNQEEAWDQDADYVAAADDHKDAATSDVTVTVTELPSEEVVGADAPTGLNK